MGVKVATGDQVGVFDSSGARTLRAETEETRQAKSNREVRIYLAYHCENGHNGNIIFQFCEGVTSVEHEELEKGIPLEVIWQE